MLDKPAILRAGKPSACTGKPATLIVGAGPTGLTAAVELARHGLRPRVIDQDAGPTPLSKAVGVSPRSLEILEPSGITERLLAAGVRIRQVQLHFEGRLLGSLQFSMLPHRFAFLLSVPQSDTEAAMAAALAELGIRIEWQTTFVGLRRTGGRVEALLEGPEGREAANFDCLFGADGMHSAVRGAMGLPFEGITRDRLWSIADVEIGDWPYERVAAHAFLHRDGDVGFIIPTGPDTFRAVSNTEDALSRVPGRYRIARRLRSDTFQIQVRQVPRYQTDGLFLGGDAAHVQSPVGARGMNLGIEDAAAFARRMLTNDLEGYTAERRPVGHRWIKLSERLLDAAEARHAEAIALRNMALRVVGHLRPMQRAVLKRMAGLKE